MSGSINFDRNNVPKATKEAAKQNVNTVRNIGYLSVMAAGTSNAMVIEQTATGNWRAVAHVLNVGASAYLAHRVNKQAQTALTQVVLEQQAALDKHKKLTPATITEEVAPAVSLGVAGLCYLLGKRGT